MTKEKKRELTEVKFRLKINKIYFELKKNTESFSQRDFAKVLEVTQPTVQRYLSGKKIPNDPMVMKQIMKVGKCSFEDLFGPID